MDLGRHTTTTEAWALIGIVQYYRNMFTIKPHVLTPLKEASISAKSKNILWNNDLSVDLWELKQMVSDETLLNYLDCTIKFTVQKYASDKHLGAIIIQNNKPIHLFLKMKQAIA